LPESNLVVYWRRASRRDSIRVLGSYSNMHPAKVYLTTFLLAVVGVGVTNSALAQAWLPPPGEGTLTVTYQDTLSRGHLYSDGSRVPGELGHDPVRAHSLVTEVEWGITDRVAVHGAIPFVAAKYGGSEPHSIGVLGHEHIDDGTFHGGSQDFRFGVRYGLKTGPLAVAPFAEGIVPSRSYESLGHSVIGRDLLALVAGVNVGGFLEALTPGLYFHTQASYAFVESAANIHPNRSNVNSELGYFVTPRFAVRLIQNLQFTHDGFPFLKDPPEPDLTDRAVINLLLNHDRLKQSNFLSFGGGLTFAFTQSLNGFLAAGGMVWGQSVPPHRGVSAGVSWALRP
jgi:hypothetical protein